jgi:hypothetical protein
MPKIQFSYELTHLSPSGVTYSYKGLPNTVDYVSALVITKHMFSMLGEPSEIVCKLEGIY